MDASFTEEQEDLRQLVRAVLRDHGSPEQVRAASAGSGVSLPAWRALGEQSGLAGLALPGDVGGVDASFIEVAVVLEELGAALLPTPYLSTVTAGLALYAAADFAVAKDLLPEVAAGTRVATLAVAGRDGRCGPGALTTTAAPGPAGAGAGADYLLSGEADHVLDGHLAGLLVAAADAPDGPALFAAAAAAPGLRVTRRPTLDQTRPQAGVAFDATPAVRLSAEGDGGRAVAHALDLVAVALAVESVGAARRILETTVQHLKDRVQFARPLAAFQALRHRCADLAVEVSSAASTAYYAAWAVDGDPSGLPAIAPLAKLHCARVFRRVAAEAIQLHGGIGFTWEHPAHLYFKRATSTELLFGTERDLRRLVGTRAGLLP